MESAKGQSATPKAKAKGKANATDAAPAAAATLHGVAAIAVGASRAVSVLDSLSGSSFGEFDCDEEQDACVESFRRRRRRRSRGGVSPRAPVVGGV